MSALFDEWGPIKPLSTYGELPTFPAGHLPPVLRDWCHAVAEATQTPVALPAFLVLSACAVALQGKIAVEVKPGWIEPVNLFPVVALDPGSRKSAVFREAFQPVQEWERREIESTREHVAVAQASYETLKRSLESAQKKAASAEGEARAEAIRKVEELARQFADASPPITPHLLADDCTPEKLASLMADHGGRIAVASAEGGVFDMMAGRYSDGIPNLDVYLKGHSGDTLRVDRVNRPSVYVQDPALTLALAVQPEVLRGLAGRPAMRGRGLLARFLYAVPESGIGKRKTDPQILPAHLSGQYNSLIRDLLSMPFAKGEDGRKVPCMVKLSAEALAELLGFMGELEPKLSRVGEMGHVQDWGGKLAGAVARIAGLMHAAEGREGPINFETLYRARRIAEDFLIPHALAAFEIMGGKKEVALAGSMREWIARNHKAQFSERDLHRALHARVDGPGEWREPCRLNVETGLLREIPQEPTGGRPPSPSYEVNPAFLNGGGA